MKDQEEMTAGTTEDEEVLSKVAALIQPLPENVIPSSEFLQRTRSRLLRLENKPERNDRRAA